MGEQWVEGNPARSPASPEDQQNLDMQHIMPIVSAVVEQDRGASSCTSCPTHPPSPGTSLHPCVLKRVFLDPQPKGRAPHRPGGEDLHDAWLGALAAGLVVFHHEAAGQLPGGVGEAAGGRWVRANCEEQRWSSAVVRDGEQGREMGPQTPGTGRWNRRPPVWGRGRT